MNGKMARIMRQKFDCSVDIDHRIFLLNFHDLVATGVWLEKTSISVDIAFVSIPLFDYYGAFDLRLIVEPPILKSRYIKRMPAVPDEELAVAELENVLVADSGVLGRMASIDWAVSHFFPAGEMESLKSPPSFVRLNAFYDVLAGNDERACELLGIYFSIIESKSGQSAKVYKGPGYDRAVLVGSYMKAGDFEKARCFLQGCAQGARFAIEKPEARLTPA